MTCLKCHGPTADGWRLQACFRCRDRVGLTNCITCGTNITHEILTNYYMACRSCHNLIGNQCMYCTSDIEAVFNVNCCSRCYINV